MDMDSACTAKGNTNGEVEKSSENEIQSQTSIGDEGTNEKNPEINTDENVEAVCLDDINEGPGVKKCISKKRRSSKVERNTQNDTENNKESHIIKNKSQSKQMKHNKKLKKDAESSSHISDLETRNKMFDKIKESGAKESLNGGKKLDGKTSSIIKRNDEDENDLIKAKCSTEKDGNSNDRKRLDWSEQLLFLEMSHSKLDGINNTEEDVTNDNIETKETQNSKEPTETKLAGRDKTKEFKIKRRNRKRSTVEEEKEIGKEALNNQVKKFRTEKSTNKECRKSVEIEHNTINNEEGVTNDMIGTKETRNSKEPTETKLAERDKTKEFKIRRRNRKRSTVEEDKAIGKEALNNQVKKVRTEKSTNKERRKSVEIEHNTISNDMSMKIDVSESAVACCTDLNLKDNSLANPCKELIPNCASTPSCAKSKPKRKYTKKKTCKRKVSKTLSKNSSVEKASFPEDILDVTSETSLLDLSLPTPQPPRKDYQPFSYSYDGKDLEDDCSSDEDLPVGLTPLKIEKSFTENDIVWVKWKKWPYLPALVKKVYKKKKRLTCAVFSPNDGFEEDFPMGYGNPGAVISYCDPKKDQIVADVKSLNKEDQAFFKGSCAHAENFLTRETLKELKSHGALEEDVQKDESELEKGDDNEEEITASKKKRKRRESVTESDCTITKVEKNNNVLSKQGQKRIEKMAQRTKPLTEFLISDTTKEYLQNIYNGNINSDLHQRFLSGTIRERAKMKHRGFGPIDDDEQIELLLSTYMDWLKEINNRTIHEINYVFDVWVPEAIVFALMKTKSYCRKRAWEQFDKGVRRTKEELRIIHKDLIDVETARKNISDKVIDFVLK